MKAPAIKCRVCRDRGRFIRRVEESCTYCDAWFAKGFDMSKDEIGKAADELNEALAAAETVILSWGLVAPGSVPMSLPCTRLHWTKNKEVYGLVVERGTGEYCALANCSLSMRVEAAGLIPSLVTVLVTEREALLACIGTATGKLLSWVAPFASNKTPLDKA